MRTICVAALVAVVVVSGRVASAGSDMDALTTTQATVDRLSEDAAPTLSGCDSVGELVTAAWGGVGQLCDSGDELERRDCARAAAKLEKTARALLKKLVVELPATVESAEYNLKKKVLKITLKGSCEHGNVFVGEPKTEKLSAGGYFVMEKLVGRFYVAEVPMSEDEARSADIRNNPARAKGLVLGKLKKFGKKELRYNGDMVAPVEALEQGRYWIVSIDAVKVTDGDGADIVATGAYKPAEDEDAEDALKDKDAGTRESKD